MILTSNTLGHIHGKNTRGETVCTVTGSGENGSADQEFRLYTVSDRTPPPLLAGDLSLVEARPGELDIRVSVPEGSLNYVRLAWGKAGDQPTFRVVEGVSDETVLTIPGLEAGTEYDVRAYLMTFQSFDLYRVGNAGPPVGLIPEGRPDNKWIRNLSSAGLGKSQTITVRTAYGLSLSIDDVKESENAGSMTFEVTLSETSNEVVTVDWATSDGTAEAPGDYEATTAGRLTFAPGETTQTFQVTIEDDAVDEAEEETFTVTLSNAVNADLSDASATGTITDDDAPAVTVSFEQGAYSVAEGSGVTVKVQLSADPERTVTIPLSATDRGGASNDDYSGVPDSVVFGSGETEKSFTFTATADEVDDDGESVELSFGTLPDRVTVGSTATSTVSITDDDTAGVTVSESALTIEEGGDATYTVRLDTQPTDSVTVTVNDPADTDVTAEPASLTFSASTWSTAQTVTVSAKQDDDAIDEEQARHPHGERSRLRVGERLRRGGHGHRRRRPGGEGELRRVRLQRG